MSTPTTPPIVVPLILAARLCRPSNSRARVECSDVYFSLCLSMIFTHMQTWLPINSDSPKLVEMISIKVLILVWCLF